MEPRLGVITNLNARRNRADPDRPARLAALVGPHGIVRVTGGPEELGPIVAEFAAHSLRYWICDGGDGTLHGVLNAGRALMTGLEDAPLLVPTNGGTIDFVAKKAGIRGRADQVIARLLALLEREAAPAAVELDTFELSARRPGDPAGTRPFSRLGFGSAIGGIGQHFFTQYYAGPVQGGRGIARTTGRALLGLAGSLPGVRRLPLVSDEVRAGAWELLAPTAARVVVDGKELPERRLRGLHVGAIDVNVANVRLFPFAATPGQLHFVVGDINPATAPFHLVTLLLGTPAWARGWHELAGEHMQVWAEGGQLLDPVIDGERYFGFEALEVRLGPRVRMPVLGRA